jgi:hypothetical protein
MSRTLEVFGVVSEFLIKEIEGYKEKILFLEASLDTEMAENSSLRNDVSRLEAEKEQLENAIKSDIIKLREENELEKQKLLQIINVYKTGEIPE